MAGGSFGQDGSRGIVVSYSSGPIRFGIRSKRAWISTKAAHRSITSSSESSGSERYSTANGFRSTSVSRPDVSSPTSRSSSINDIRSWVRGYRFPRLAIQALRHFSAACWAWKPKLSWEKTSSRAGSAGFNIPRKALRSARAMRSRDLACSRSLMEDLPFAQRLAHDVIRRVPPSLDLFGREGQDVDRYTDEGEVATDPADLPAPAPGLAG